MLNMKNTTKDSAISMNEVLQSEKKSSDLIKVMEQQRKRERKGKFVDVIVDGAKYKILVKKTENAVQAKRRFTERISARII